ncbi:NAD-dependent epimerase/dehydratase family protein [Amycolatopsis sp. NBC_00345]|uniref:NAD-dependent epimerase/dehydratase family protein n=1 Tax=Amycolatopsis sp. NBC_00345 TaxID=2975955 RepID=UPI002E270D93
MEIVGRGFLARNLRVLEERHPDATVFAAGVSSTANTSLEDYAREAGLLYDVIRRCQADRRRLVYLSTASASMYGDGPSEEDGPVFPGSPFGRHKLALEAVLAASGVEFLVLRLAHAVGAHQRPHQLLPSFIRQIREGSLTVHRGAGRDLIDAADVVTIVDGLLRRGIGREVFNVASGFPVAAEDIVALLEDRLGATAEKTFVERPQRHDISTTKLLSALPEAAGLGFGPGYHREVVDRYLRSTGVLPHPDRTARQLTN